MTMITRPLPSVCPRTTPGPATPSAGGRPREDESRRLLRACAEFESIFVEQLFKTMRASIPATGLLNGGRAEEIYTGMLDQQVAMEMARGQSTIGLARQMQGRLAPAAESDPSGNERP